MEKAAKAGGAAVVAREFTKNDATDFTAILTKIKGKKPDVIFYGGMDAQAGPMLKQIKTLGINAKFLTGDGGCSPEMIKLAGDAAEGVYCSQAGLPLEKMPRGADFAKRYKAKFNTDVQIYSPYSYDAVLVIADAVKRANSADAAKIVAELPNTATDGVTGKVQFDSKGDVKNGAITVYTVKSGKLEVLEVQGGSLMAQAESAVKEAVKDAKEAAGDAAKAVGDAAKKVEDAAKK
jgi:branched-chain amino acid transport system substrate-binding protein